MPSLRRTRGTSGTGATRRGRSDPPRLGLGRSSDSAMRHGTRQGRYRSSSRSRFLQLALVPNPAVGAPVVVATAQAPAYVTPAARATAAFEDAPARHSVARTFVDTPELPDSRVSARPFGGRVFGARRVRSDEGDHRWPSPVWFLANHSLNFADRCWIRSSPSNA